jgi:preprotein translocase subunit Sss1
VNILILGCSFGVPDNGCPAKFHTENQLKLLGYSVINCARPCSSNLESLTIAQTLLENKPPKIDWIVWFHTELIRDVCFLSSNIKSFSLISLNEAAVTVYKEYKKIIQKTGAKIAIVGGAGPVHPLLYDYIRPDFCIPSWFNEILNLTLPQIQTLSRLDVIEEMQSIGSEMKLKILLQHEEILNALEASDDFPDNYHPGARPHIELTQRLHTIFLYQR